MSNPQLSKELLHNLPKEPPKSAPAMVFGLRQAIFNLRRGFDGNECTPAEVMSLAGAIRVAHVPQSNPALTFSLTDKEGWSTVADLLVEQAQILQDVKLYIGLLFQQDEVDTVLKIEITLRKERIRHLLEGVLDMVALNDEQPCSLARDQDMPDTVYQQTTIKNIVQHLYREETPYQFTMDDGRCLNIISIIQPKPGTQIHCYLQGEQDITINDGVAISIANNLFPKGSVIIGVMRDGETQYFRIFISTLHQ